MFISNSSLLVISKKFISNRMRSYQIYFLKLHITFMNYLKNNLSQIKFVYLLTDSTNRLPARIVYLRRKAREQHTPEIRSAFAKDRRWRKYCWDQNLRSWKTSVIE